MLAPAADRQVARTDNNPPSPIDAAKEAMTELSAWLKEYPVIVNADEAKNGGAYVERTRVTLNEIESERKRIVSPINAHLTTVNAVLSGDKGAAEKGAHGAPQAADGLCGRGGAKVHRRGRAAAAGTRGRGSRGAGSRADRTGRRCAGRCRGVRCRCGRRHRRGRCGVRRLPQGRSPGGSGGEKCSRPNRFSHGRTHAFHADSPRAGRRRLPPMPPGR